MVVYWEYAFIGNALPDGLLLYLAVRCARMRVRPWRLLLASAMGGAFVAETARMGGICRQAPGRRGDRPCGGERQALRKLLR